MPHSIFPVQCKLSVRFVVLPLYFRIVLTEHNLHATLVLSTGPSFSLKNQSGSIRWTSLSCLEQFQKILHRPCLAFEKKPQSNWIGCRNASQRGDNKMFCGHFECGQEAGGEFENKHGGPCRGRLFWRKIVPLLGIRISTDRREEKRNFLIQGRRFRRSFKNYCNYQYFMKLLRLLSIVKLGIDVLLSEHLQSRCIDSSMYRYNPIYLRTLQDEQAFCPKF